jgi:hypothetical protein
MSGKAIRDALGLGSTQKAICLLLVALMLAGCGIFGSDEPKWVIRGTVWADPTGSTPSDGHLLDGAVVSMESLASTFYGGSTVATTMADAAGRFEIEIDPCAASLLTAEKAGYYRAGTEGWYWEEAVALGCSSPFSVEGVVIHMQLVEEPEATIAFTSQPSATPQDCDAPPPGSVCVAYSDNYIWIVIASGDRAGGAVESTKVNVVRIGDQFEYHRVVGTDLVAQVALDP